MKTKEITLQEASELIKSAGTSLQKDIMSVLKDRPKDCKIICYNGNTRLPELEVGRDIIIVNGNLNVTGIIKDCKGVDSSLLIVLGNVTCKNLITLSAIYITGDLKVAHTLLGDSLNNYSCAVGGNLKVRTIIENGHWIEVKGEAKFKHYYHKHCKAEDKNGKLKPNLADSDLMDYIEMKPGKFKNHSYVPLIAKVQTDDTLDLSKAIKFIRKGGEWFCKQ